MACIGRITEQCGRPNTVVAQDYQLVDIRHAESPLGCIGSWRGSEYRLRPRDNITPAEGRNPTLFKQPTSGGSGDCIMLITPNRIRTLQRELYCKAKQ